MSFIQTIFATLLLYLSLSLTHDSHSQCVSLSYLYIIYTYISLSFSSPIPLSLYFFVLVYLILFIFFLLWMLSTILIFSILTVSNMNILKKWVFSYIKKKKCIPFFALHFSILWSIIFENFKEYYFIANILKP